jgi:hypothetical protein
MTREAHNDDLSRRVFHRRGLCRPQLRGRTPEEALQLARRFYDDDIGELDFRSYDDNAGIDQIQIWDNEHGTLALWESDDYRLRQAAPDLYKALEYFFNIMHDYDSRRRKGYIRLAMEQARAALAKAGPVTAAPSSAATPIK